nr:hypothetical protein CFP56_03766 [Quercus suber]
MKLSLKCIEAEVGQMVEACSTLDTMKTSYLFSPKYATKYASLLLLRTNRAYAMPEVNRRQRVRDEDFSDLR